MQGLIQQPCNISNDCPKDQNLTVSSDWTDTTAKDYIGWTYCFCWSGSTFIYSCMSMIIITTILWGISLITKPLNFVLISSYQSATSVCTHCLCSQCHHSTFICNKTKTKLHHKCQDYQLNTHSCGLKVTETYWFVIELERYTSNASSVIPCYMTQQSPAHEVLLTVI